MIPSKYLQGLLYSQMENCDGNEGSIKIFSLHVTKLKKEIGNVNEVCITKSGFSLVKLYFPSSPASTALKSLELLNRKKFEHTSEQFRDNSSMDQTSSGNKDDISRRSIQPNASSTYAVGQSVITSLFVLSKIHFA